MRAGCQLLSVIQMAKRQDAINAQDVAIQEVKKSRKMELERERSAGSYCQSTDEERPAVAQAHINQQLRRCARYGISCDDISSDVITISSWQSEDEEKRKR
ncbi:hypothetical protein F511_44011 [Dorcoceras hygrometricum]|uniref:Uncharacterized protein n=1 Tax=Dorcoceras hygrometricum TaxID=472368 RepID=A0A2Z7A9C8_9LAMI|nr:hypothetical protein F511_44011 [Dorcoceras hygrometricum]